MVCGITTFAMQKTPAQWYAKSANEKLMNILSAANQYGNKRNTFLADVKNTLNEGADPNYAFTYKLQNPHARPADKDFPREHLYINKTTTPLNEALNLRDEELMKILLEAGANPDLKNIYVNQQNTQSAREIAQEKHLTLPTIPKPTTQKIQ